MSRLNPIASLYDCQVMHQRWFPHSYRFQYRVFSLLLDIDRLDEIAQQRFLSINRFNLFSIYTQDHGDRSEKSWRTWINETLASQGLKVAHRVQVQCFPRILGYGFNPLSLWYCYDKQSELYAVVCEVSNTFGEHHHYLLHEGGAPLALPVKANKNKIFHVSPFINMEQEYRFTIDKPGEQLRVVIQEYEQNALMLVATQQGQRHALSSSNLLKYFFKVPFMTFKIMVLIHWHALKLGLAGAKFYRKPEPPDEIIS